MFGYMIRRFGFRIFVTQSIILRIMEEEFSKQSELLSALAGIREKLEAVHLDVLAVKKQHNMIEGDPILDFYDTCRMLHQPMGILMSICSIDIPHRNEMISKSE